MSQMHRGQKWKYQWVACCVGFRTREQSDAEGFALTSLPYYKRIGERCSAAPPSNLLPGYAAMTWEQEGHWHGWPLRFTLAHLFWNESDSRFGISQPSENPLQQLDEATGMKEFSNLVRNYALDSIHSWHSRGGLILSNTWYDVPVIWSPRSHPSTQDEPQ